MFNNVVIYLSPISSIGARMSRHLNKGLYAICQLGPYSENCVPGLENTAQGGRLRAAFSSPRSRHSFHYNTDQP